MVSLSLLAVLASASLAVAHSGVLADGGKEHMRMLAKRSSTKTSKCSGSHRGARKNYRQRASASASSGGAASTSAKAQAANVQVKAALKASSSEKASSTKVFNDYNPSSTSSSAKAAGTTYASSSGSSAGKGLFGVSDSKCGASGATESSTNDAGPNGSQDWLNCGVTSGGWTPPFVKLEDLKTLSLDDAVAKDNSVFSACAPYLSHFDRIGGELGIPPILLASIAMQESSCNPKVLGDNGGAFGLMQITEDKCGNAPNGDCTDIDYNLSVGAKYLKSEIDAKGGNILLALGQYNGWYSGLTTGGAMKIRTQCWACQQNLDYFQQLLNGWLQGIDGSKLGNVRNLDE